MPIPAGGVIYPGRDEPTNSVEVEAAFGANLTADPGTWSWTDLSSRLLADPIRLRAGKSGGTAHVSPGTCTVTLDNDDGALTPLHPLSAYFPNVRRGTPLRVSLRRVEDAFARTLASGWGSTDTDDVWEGYGSGGTTLATDFLMGSGKARHSVPVVSAYRTSWLPGLSLPDCRVHLSGVSLPFSDVTGGPVEPGNILLRAQSLTEYYLARVEVTTAEAVMCKLYDPSGVELASATVSGLTHTSAQTLEVVADISGTTLSMKVWATAAAEPAGWTVTATDDGLNLPGGIGVRTGVGAGNTNTKPIVASYESVTVFVDRFSGFADQWEPDYLTTTTPGQASSKVQVTASGLLRRLDQGAKPARSAPARYIPSTSPLAYWPLEDGQTVTEGAALVGSAPMRPFVGTHPSGAVITFTQWGRGDLAPWLPQALSRAGNHGLAIVWAPVSMPATGRWVVDFIYRSGTDAGDSAVDVNPSYLGGSLGWPQLSLLPEFRGLDVAMNGEPEVNGTAATLFDGQAHHVRWDVFQDGLKVSWVAYVDGAAVNFGTTAGNMSLPAMSALALTAGAQAGADMAQGHVAVWTSPPPVEDAVFAARGYAGETAADRIGRLCAEEGIAVSVGGGDSEPLGPQPVAGLMDLLREAEEADMGVLFEQGYGLGYRPRGDRYNAAALMTVDLSQYRVARGGSRDVLKPVYDDQDLRNEWTVGRKDGSTATVADAAHQDQSGVYSDSVELNVATDGRLLDHASWRVHLGTVDELRESTFPLDLAANPDLMDGWLSCRVGSRVVRTNPPAQYQPGDLDRLVEGWTETIGPRSWMVQVTPSPSASWDVATVDGTQRVAADGSALGVALGASDVSLVIASTVGNGLWTQDPADFPLDVRVGGEQVTVSAIGPAAALNANALFEGGTVAPWSSPDATVSVSTAQAHSGSASMLLTPTGAAGMARAESESVPCVPGRVYQNFAWVRCAVARTVDINAVWLTAGGGFISIVSNSVAVPANTWVPLGATFTAPVGAGQARAQFRLNGTPPAGHLTWIDEAFFIDVGHQTVTLSARGVNGVTRAWPAGTEVDVWAPAIAPL